MGEYRLWSFLPWLAFILLDVAVEDDVVQDLAHVVFKISKNSYNTKPTVILNFSMPDVFWLWPTVLQFVSRVQFYAKLNVLNLYVREQRKH